MKRKSRLKRPPEPVEPVTLDEQLADAHAEYRRAKAAKDREPSKTNVENWHRARTALKDLGKQLNAQQAVKPAGVMARKR